MTELVIAITLIALPDSLNPSLILTALFLAGGRHPARSTAVFTLAAGLTTLGGGLVVALGAGDLMRSLLAKPSPVAKDVVTVVVGAVLVGAGALLWSRRERAAARGYTREGAAGVLGAAIAGVELLTAFPYFAAIALVVGSDASGAQTVALLVLYNVVYALPLIAIAVLCAVAGAGAQRLLSPVSDWLTRRWPALVAALSGAVGLGLVAYGGARLATA